jgi:hypothetical protein
MMSPSTMALEVTHYLLHGGITRVNGWGTIDCHWMFFSLPPSSLCTLIFMLGLIRIRYVLMLLFTLILVSIFLFLFALLLMLFEDFFSIPRHFILFYLFKFNSHPFHCYFYLFFNLFYFLI